MITCTTICVVVLTLDRCLSCSANKFINNEVWIWFRTINFYISGLIASSFSELAIRIKTEIAQPLPRWLTVFRCQGKFLAIFASRVLPCRLNHRCESEPSNINFCGLWSVALPLLQRDWAMINSSMSAARITSSMVDIYCLQFKTVIGYRGAPRWTLVGVSFAFTPVHLI